MKGIYTLLFSLIVLVMFSACNDEWKEEQFEHYISFKAPINSNGVTRINLSYSETGKTTYRLPILVSGSTKNDRDITVKIGIDADTLRTLNIARFSSREDLWYREMPSKHYSFPETVQIKAGENVGYLDIEFDLTGLDLVDKWNTNRIIVSIIVKHYSASCLLMIIRVHTVVLTYKASW